MYKQSTFAAQNEQGYTAIPLFGSADSEFEKTAAPCLLPPVLSYIEGLRPKQNSQYVLVNALGASEYYSSNINGDSFPEAALIHGPPNATGNPLVDKALAKNTHYGYLTFYNAHPYAHHKNKDPSRAYGEVELSVWNDTMKRVELVVRVDYDKCCQFGGVPVWDKLKQGQFPDVSMGAKVPYDTSSITLDWKLYKKAQETFDPKKHKHPGEAVLAYHKKLKAKDGKGIAGVSVTRNDYDEWCKRHMNRILPDGRKVFVYNDYPRFFDISFVFIGADRTAKTMVYLARNISDTPVEKTASDAAIPVEVTPGLSKVAGVTADWARALIKGAEEKRSEMEKEIVPSQFAAKAVPVMAGKEPHLPKEVQNLLGSFPLAKALSTLTGLGMVLRPAEFQRVCLVGQGHGELADAFDSKGLVFPKSPSSNEDLGIDSSNFVRSLARLLMPLMSMRSALGPFVERRVIILSGELPKTEVKTASHSSELLRKIGSAYGAYRNQLMDMVANSQDLIEKAASPTDAELLKVASASAEEVFTPLSFCYLRDAFHNEAPIAKEAKVVIGN